MIIIFTIGLIATIIFVRWLCHYPGAGKVVSYRSSHTVTASLIHLKQACLPLNANTLICEWMTGEIQSKKVTIRRHQRGSSSSFSPAFTGRFIEDRDGALLCGSFAMESGTQGFLAIWMMGIFVVFSMCLTEFLFKHPPGALLGIVLSATFAAAGVWLVRVGKAAASDDVVWLDTAIKASLGCRLTDSRSDPGYLNN